MKCTSKVNSIIYENNSSGFKVAFIELDGEDFKITGIMPGLLEGGTYEFELSEDVHISYGFQFKVSSFRLAKPEEVSDMEHFLASGAFKGIGPSTAKKIIAHFGDRAMDIISDDIDRLTEVSGIGEKTLVMIKESIEEHLDASETLYELSKLGFNLSQSKRIYDRYGKTAMEKIETNPYRLLFDVKKMNFKLVDEVALKNGFESTSPQRLEALVVHTLKKIVYGEGHLYVEKKRLIAELTENIRLDIDTIEKALVDLESIYHVIRIDESFGNVCVYLSESFEWERGIVEQLMRIVQTFRNKGDFSGLNPSTYFSPEQLGAISHAFDEGVFILTGAAGTGKTTIMRELIERALNSKMSIALAAPTGRAASRIEEVVGMPASTIHRLLEYEFDEDDSFLYFKVNEGNTLDADVVFIDEASMIDAQLFYALLKGIKSGSQIVLIGDPNQLPPVGPGFPFVDLIKSGAFNVKELKGIYRQETSSLILKNAYSVLENGSFQYNEGEGDFFLFSEVTQTRTLERVKDLVSSRIPKVFGFEPLSSITVISPVKSGALGVQSLNKELQTCLNPLADKLYFGKFAVGDKVMQIKNNYNIEWVNQNTGEDGKGVFNGEMGFLVRASSDDITVKYIDGKLIKYRGESIQELELAYAMTVHKAQGNEFDVVVFPAFPFAPIMQSKNLMYTAITRAKKLFVVAGSRACFEKSALTEKLVKRNGNMRARLEALCE